MKTLAIMLPVALVLAGSPLVGQEQKKPLTATLKAEVAAEVRGGEADVNVPPPGFTALFNGRDFRGWKVPEGDGGHWKVVDGVIDYDAASEAGGSEKGTFCYFSFGTRTHTQPARPPEQGINKVECPLFPSSIAQGPWSRHIALRNASA